MLSAVIMLGIGHMSAFVPKTWVDLTRRMAQAPGDSASRRTFYVDARKGKDSNTGLSPKNAWQSIARANLARFLPGDRLLFAGGQTYNGTLRLTAASGGTAARPVLISFYGNRHPTIYGGAGNGLELINCAFVTLKGLAFTGCGRKNGSDGAGISVVRTQNVVIDHVEVSGYREAGITTGGDRNTRITYAYAHDNGYAGITTDAGFGALPRTKNLTIAYCRADNNPGDPKNLTNHSGNGIVVGGVDGGLIEYCEASNNGWDMPRDGNGPVGIWGWNCDRLTIQHCISHDNKSPGTDGGGFDFDGGVTNSNLQYNLSYHNMGCGYLLCQYAGAPTWRNNTMRYNISIDDGVKNFHSGIGLWIGGGDFSDAQIYNNTIINPRHAVSTLGDVPGFIYRNNIFVSGDHVIDATLGGGYGKSRFENNAYWSPMSAMLYRDEKVEYATMEEWAKATHQETIAGTRSGIWADPRLALPNEKFILPIDPLRLQSMRYYRLRRGSPCIGAGSPIPNNGGRDIFGHPVNADQQPALGASERGR